MPNLVNRFTRTYPCLFIYLVYGYFCVTMQNLQVSRETVKIKVLTDILEKTFPDHRLDSVSNSLAISLLMLYIDNATETIFS